LNIFFTLASRIIWGEGSMKERSIPLALLPISPCTWSMQQYFKNEVNMWVTEIKIKVFNEKTVWMNMNTAWTFCLQCWLHSA
jgi:hypothetical protein